MTNDSDMEIPKILRGWGNQTDNHFLMLTLIAYEDQLLKQASSDFAACVVLS